MDLSFSTLFAGFAFGIMGAFLMKQGKKNGHFPHLLVGLTLILFPYFISSTWLTWGIGGILLAIAYRIR